MTLASNIFLLGASVMLLGSLMAKPDLKGIWNIGSGVLCVMAAVTYIFQ